MDLMRLLILGGTRFLGRATAETASAAGWDGTTFNRGRSGSDLPGVQAIRGDRGVAVDLARLAESGPWDAVVDTSGYVPRNTLAVAHVLRPVADPLCAARPLTRSFIHSDRSRKQSRTLQDHLYGESGPYKVERTSIAFSSTAT